MTNRIPGVSNAELTNSSPADVNQRHRALVPVQPSMAGQPAYPSAAPQGPEILHGGINQTWLMNCLRRRWLMALLLGLLFGGLASLLMLWLFPESSSTIALIEVKPKAETNVLGDEERLTPKEIELRMAKHLTLVRSQLVLEPALAEPSVAQLEAVLKEDDPVLWLYEDLRVSFPMDGEVMEIRYDGEESPEDMQQVVQSIVDKYEQEAKFRERDRQNAIYKQLVAERNQIDHDLQEKIEEFDRKSSADVSKYSASAEVEMRQLQADISMLEKLIADARGRLVDIEVAKEVAYREARSPAATEAVVRAELDADPTLAGYDQEVYTIDQMIRSMQSTTRNPKSAALKRLYDQKNALLSAKEQYRLQKSAELRRQLEQMPNEMLRAVMVEYEIRRAASLQQIADYEQQVKEKTDRLTQLGQNDPAMEMLLGDIENLREVQKELAVSLQGMSVQKVAADRVRVIQNAVATPKINTIERFTIAGMGGLAAMLATCYAVALIEFRRRRLNGPRDIDEGLGLRVLGVLPATTPRKSLAGGSLVSAQVAEAIDNVRATLMHDSTSHRRQIVLVTSPDTMEGSTTVACNLAASLARAGRRTLLIDGDVRAPALHKLFGLPLEDGLCEVLRSEIDLADVVQATNTEGLYLLTAGVCDMEAVHALATDLPQPIFEKLRGEFDFVIIDGAPVLGLSDTVSLGQHVDGAIMTLLRDHSEVRKIHQATELMKDLGIDLIGAVVNGVPLKADRRIAQLHKSHAARTKQLPAAKKPAAQAEKTAAQEPVKATQEKPAAEEEIVLDEDFDLGLDD